MVYLTISPDMKQKALYLLLEEGWEIDQITTASEVHSRSIERWEHKYENHGCVNPPAAVGDEVYEVFKHVDGDLASYRLLLECSLRPHEAFNLQDGPERGRT